MMGSVCLMQSVSHSVHPSRLTSCARLHCQVFRCSDAEA